MADMYEGNPYDAEATEADRIVEEEPVRGGMSFGAVLTGMMVMLGTTALAALPVAAIAIWSSFDAYTLTRTEAMRLAIAAGATFGALGFLAAMWGGYTAGRMSRGAGARNGLLVPIMLILVAGMVVAATGAAGGLASPLRVDDLAISRATLMNITAIVAIAAGVAMLTGGVLGGSLGARWHTKLERRAATERRARRPLFRRRRHALPA